MTEQRIDPVLVEKAARAMWGGDEWGAAGRCYPWDPEMPDCQEAMAQVSLGLAVFGELLLKERLANDLYGDVVRERDRLREALERADGLLMAANGALYRVTAHAYDAPDRSVMTGALEDVRARLVAVSGTTLTALHGPGSRRPVEQGDAE
jgi:hypothetical protein